jgi:hypothetical protein
MRYAFARRGHAKSAVTKIDRKLAVGADCAHIGKRGKSKKRVNMMEQTMTPKRKRGRPYAGGRDTVFAARLPEAIIKGIRDEAIRRGKSPSAIAREAMSAYVLNLGYELGEARAA